MRNLHKCFSIGFLILVCFVNLSNAQADSDGWWWNGISEPWHFNSEHSKVEIAIMQNRWKLIEEENKAYKFSEWVGDYFIGGETHGMYLRWSPQNGFVIIDVNKCAAQVQDFSYGRVSTAKDLVQFITDRPMARRKHSNNTKKQESDIWVQVKFRGVRYLIPENRMSEFGDYIAGLGIYNESEIYHGFGMDFFRMAGDEENDEQNPSPILPSEYKQFLKSPLTGNIIGVKKREVKKEYSFESPSGYERSYYDWVSITYVIINVGKLNGATEGLSFRVVKTDEELRLIEVSDNKSVGVIVRQLDKNKKESFYDHEQIKIYPKISVGWRLTTSPFND